MGTNRRVFTWYLALWLVLALAPAVCAVFDFGGKDLWLLLRHAVLTPVSAEARAMGGTLLHAPARPSPAPAVPGLPVQAREDDWLTHPVRPLD